MTKTPDRLMKVRIFRYCEKMNKLDKYILVRWMIIRGYHSKKKWISAVMISDTTGWDRRVVSGILTQLKNRGGLFKKRVKGENAWFYSADMAGSTPKSVCKGL